VNDKLTFHFQAVGDSERERAHIVYLDEGLSVSHALYEKGEWQISRSVLEVACFAPQIAIDVDGNAALVAAGYDRALWRASWSRNRGWSAPRKIEGALAPNISPAFAITGYGTGGMISAARSSTGRVPYLLGVVTDETTARAELYAAQFGDTLSLRHVSVRVSGNTVEADIHLAGLREAEMKRAGRCWLVVIPAGGGRALKLAAVAGGGGIDARGYWQERDGSLRNEAAPVRSAAEPHDAFSPGEHGTLKLALPLAGQPQDLDPRAAWVEFYSDGWSPERGGTLVDIAPFDPETAARIAAAPALAPYSFRRMV
jgi:hypothetical protein